MSEREYQDYLLAIEEHEEEGNDCVVDYEIEDCRLPGWDNVG